MIPIHIDTTPIVDQFNVTDRQVEQFIDFVVKEVTASYARMWEDEAKSGLGSTRQRYIENLNVVDEGRMKGAVILDYTRDKLIRMLEEGATPFDMKEGFENSDKVKLKKDGGWYLTIPLRLATPEALGESSVFSGTMEPEIRDIAKEKKQDIPTAGGGMRTQGIKISEIPKEHRAPKTRAAYSNIAKSKTFEEYQHKSPMGAGVSRVKDPKTGQSSYMKFRRVSDESDEQSWIHPGIEKNNFAGKAIDQLESNFDAEISHAVNEGIKALGF